MVNYKPTLRNLLLASFQKFKLLEGYFFFFPHSHSHTHTC